MSLNFNNSCSNILNTPGFISDVYANIPGIANVAIGTIFIATDTGNIYQSDGTTWNVIGGGGGGSQNLQQVTNIGNTTNNDIILQAAQTNTISDDSYNISDGAGISTIINNNFGNHYLYLIENTLESYFKINGCEFLNSGTDIDFSLYNGAGGYTAMRFNNTLIYTFFNNNNAGLFLDYSNFVYQLGDYAGVNKVNYFTVDDLNEEITSTMAGNLTGILIDRVLNVKVGDYTGNININYTHWDNNNNTISNYCVDEFHYIQSLRYDDGGSGNLISGSAGGSSGNHLVIAINGTPYKIALLNP